MSIWSVAEIPILESKHQFVQHTPSEESLITLKDASSLWIYNPNLIFIMNYRLAGNPEELQEFLVAQGLEPFQKDDVISLENYINYSGYQEELNALDVWNRSVLYANMTSPGYKLLDLIKIVNPNIGLAVPKTGKERYKAVMEVYKKPVRTNKVDLLEKIQKLAPGKVLDVSKINPNGTGITTINVPSRPGKYWAPGLPTVVSSDFDHYLIAIKLIPDGERIYRDALIFMAKLFSTDYTPLGVEEIEEPMESLEMEPALLQVPELPTVNPIAFIRSPSVGAQSVRSPSVEGINFEDRIDKLAPGKVLDVSNMKENGVGARSINPPPAQSKKVGTDNLPIISNDFEHYLWAVRLIPDGEQRYADDLSAMAEHFGVPYISPFIDEMEEIEHQKDLEESRIQEIVDHLDV